VIGKAMQKLITYARDKAGAAKSTEVAFLAAFNKTADGNGEIVYELMGVVHPDARLIPAIEQI